MFVTGLIRIMQAAGVEYEVVPGWEKRSLWRAGLANEIKAAMYHTTETVDSAFTSGRDAPTLQYVIDGQGYPLYNVLFGRSGKAYIIAAGSCAHAGRGSGGGMTRDDANRESIAFSFDANSSKYPVTAAQLESAAKVGKAMTEDWSGNLVHMMHGEWNPTDRSDPTRVPGGWSALRAAIKRGSWSTATPAASKPAASTPTPTTAKKGNTMSAKDVWDDGTYYLESHITGSNLSPATMLRDTQRKAHQASRLSATATSLVTGNKVQLSSVLRHAQRAATNADNRTRRIERQNEAILEGQAILEELLKGQGKIRDLIKAIPDQIEQTGLEDIASRLKVTVTEAEAMETDKGDK